MNCKSLLQHLVITIDEVFINAIIRTYNTSLEQMNKTTWAVQPTSWGNDLRVWADHASTWEQIEDLALGMAEDTMEEMTIFKVGSVSSFKWATRGGLG
jgi:hypothetical protein